MNLQSFPYEGNELPLALSCHSLTDFRRGTVFPTAINGEGSLGRPGDLKEPIKPGAVERHLVTLPYSLDLRGYILGDSKRYH